MVKRLCDPHPICRGEPQHGCHDGRGQGVARMRAVAILASLAIQTMACAADPPQPQADAATDSGLGLGGDSGVDSGVCGTPDPTLRSASAAELFAATSVPTFDVYLPKADWEDLKVHARDEQFVPVQACFNGRGLGTVGLRFKGSYGTLYNCFDTQGNMICPRLSMKIKFDEYVGDQRFYGLKKLAFNAYLYDDSRMKEKLAYDLFRAAGIVAPRSAWAVLRVNGESQGLFGMVEPVDGRFTADRWPASPDGNLYKELWPTHAPDSQILAALETNEETADISAYSAFAQAFTSADDASLLPTLARYMDLDYLARFMAVEDAVISYDGITYFWTDGASTGNHNYFVYEESATRFTLIPWDVESTFWINPDHAAPHWTVIPADCSLTYEYWGMLAYAPACDGVFRALNKDLDRWRAAARQLLDGPFALNAVLASIDRYEQLIGAAAHADPTPTKYTSFDNAVSGLRASIPDMRARLEGLIAPRGP
jgi:spore coat protein H